MARRHWLLKTLEVDREIAHSGRTTPDAGKPPNFSELR
jgi:hypothetical protein